MPKDYSWVTDEAFDEKLREIAQDYDLLTVPGVYELVREEFNNEVLEALEQDRENEEHISETLDFDEE